MLWPSPDRTGLAHEAERRRARLVFVDGRVIEADFSGWSTGNPLLPDWHDSIADLVGLTTLVLRDTDAREHDILRAVAALPGLTELAVEPAALSSAAREQLRRQRPALVVR
ncbi:hypothetical protein [Nannocystis sp. SCPEA4]|uniref:hypothetical protein n=1 Tax=Nannocystis sp. SCPEA4 TaxID=2996787 RepID=UPI00226E8691|nr:hypothetical protein [Nannocystis sp. SCPEA4]MCY1059524.1 hypothetical protein [Nannocystis sp. SCPEA4]